MMSRPEDIDDQDGLVREDDPEIDLGTFIEGDPDPYDPPEPEEELWTTEELDELEDD